MSTILIKNGTVVNPVGKSGRLDVLVEDGKISLMAPHIEFEADNIIDAFGHIVAPGLVDIHSHFRDPGQTWKEDILTGAEAAKRGGYTSIVMMANTVPVIDTVETLRYVLEKGAKTGIKVYAHAAVTLGMMGKDLTDMVELYQNGAVGFSDDGKPILDAGLLREAMEVTAKLGVPISLHEEGPHYIVSPGFNHGYASEQLGIGGALRDAEISMIRRDLELAVETGAIVNFQHISTSEGVELIRAAKCRNDNIHAEATPHHFSLNEDDVIKLDLNTLAKVNPPIRSEQDRQAIIKGIHDWTLDIIATDHAPHTREEKMAGLDEAPSGMIGLETALGLAVTMLDLPINRLIMRMSTNPAHVYGLNAGVLDIGRPADIVIFDQFSSWVVKNSFVSRSNNSPFIGKRLRGKVKYTICDGKIVYQDDSPF